MLLAAAVASEDRRQIWAAAVSLAGLLWLWAEGGWQYGRYVAMTVILLTAAAALAGLGIGCYWLFIARPLRQRASYAARQANAPTRRATDVELARAANSKWIESQEQAMGLSKNSTGRTGTSASRPYSGSTRAFKTSGHDAISGGIPHTWPKVQKESPTSQLARTDVTVIRLRFSYVAERSRTWLDAPGRVRLGPTSASRIRLTIDRSVVTMPPGKAGHIDEVLELHRRARDDVTFRERFVDAASEYAGDRIGNSTFEVLTRQWQTQDAASQSSPSRLPWRRPGTSYSAEG